MTMPNSFRDAYLKKTSKALIRILDLNRAHRSTWDTFPKSGQLFHYTPPEGFKGIVENNELWASSAYFLNDSQEIAYGCEILKAALEDWLKTTGCGEGSLAAGLADHLRRTFDDHLSGNFVMPIYLACFCEDGNLLSQWRAYGAAGGYSLGFNFPPLDNARLLVPEPKSFSTVLIKVEYQRAEQLRRCRTMLDAILPIFDDTVTADAIRELSDHQRANYDFFFRIVWEMLVEEAVGFKHEAFSSEKEWRLVVRTRELIKQGQDDGGKTPAPIYFRCSQGYLVPYVRLIPAKVGAKIPLQSVRSGPTIDGLRAVISVPTFLDTNGLRGVRYEESGISARP